MATNIVRPDLEMLKRSRNISCMDGPLKSMYYEHMTTLLFFSVLGLLRLTGSSSCCVGVFYHQHDSRRVSLKDVPMFHVWFLVTVVLVPGGASPLICQSKGA